eukprot:4445749-Prymnesium_polylepis.2
MDISLGACSAAHCAHGSSTFRLVTPQDLTPTAGEGVSDPPAPNAISSGGGPPPPSAKRHLLGGEGGGGFRCPTPGEGTAPRSPSASDETAEEELRSRRSGRTRRVYRFVLSHRARAGGQRTEELHRAAQAGAAGVVGAAST